MTVTHDDSGPGLLAENRAAIRFMTMELLVHREALAIPGLVAGLE